MFEKKKQRAAPSVRADSLNGWTIAVALGFVLLAVGLFYVSNQKSWIPSALWRTTLNQIAGVVVATGLLTVAWELVGKRRFAHEILAKARLSTEIVDAGINRVTNQYLEDVEWADLFRDVTRLDIVTAYARTWRNTHEQRLRQVARTSGTRIRVYLPDPDHEATVALLADRFDTSPSVLSETIREAIVFYRSLATPRGGSVEVYVRPGYAVFSCYRFDSRAVLTLYSHSKKRRTSVPTFVVAGGKLWTFVYEEIQAIRKQSSLVFPEPGPTD